ncbi:tRNA (adenosine(37)-N6)-threonylcarbamoyltransferase complex dimerization subunit type 1 TsaB [Dokdonella fugitiva]|jgi:tRNA threonylcarbamoyladenosine biosynthesis protein TsaB|uniref:tRNA threonylcarbamoyladenosine biosynthesis protein TsaB n=1 Tax=Dokdonella fugitiva TaxID=328517 RepID=A0A4R2IC92_9GAMM|nr:tRNA (adenosine(37)-N6)-threonylcarbamoyltransferase complex dimerization subunit type 1 TsaB [Dokdonella fugitiva]MBA8885073.1 tRNA threonylcarbamoyladenosine biosynthesis protein TsaB [Dokdonella fugitiva]TCO42171.1 tRNA threonylcarbamoyladenosine biosynthesis protein TsaB [Dokdonella fugitiva]
MNLLAIETATESCSVALLSGERLFARSELAPRRHAELLLPMCDEVLAEAGLARRGLDAIAVGCGPGAFTGVRLAISAAQGIAFALGIPVVPVSSLAALALQAPENDAPVLAVIDARMGEIYAGWFRRTPDGLVEPIADETVCAAADLPLAAREACNVVGSGWSTYGDVLRARLGVESVWAEGDHYPQAVDIARLALPRVRDGVAPELALPVYLRDKVALTLDEQRRGAAS